MRKLALFTAPFSLGVFLAVLMLPAGAVFPGAGVCALAGAALLPVRSRRGLAARLVCFGLAAGLGWTGWYQLRHIAPADALDGAEGTYTFTVSGYPAATRYGVSIPAELERTGGASIGALLYAKEEYAGVQPGDRLTGPVRLRRTNVSQGEASYYYDTKGIFLTANAGEELERIPCERTPVKYWPAVWAKRLKHSAGTYLPGDVAPLAVGLITGERGDLDTAAYTAFQRTGTAHIIAVSGLHVSFLAGLAGQVLGQNRRRTALAAMGMMAAFAGVAGYTPSVLRAALFQTMLLAAPVLGREEDRPTTLAGALMVILLPNPWAVVGTGLQLSFLSASGIYLLSSPLAERWTAAVPEDPRGWRRLAWGGGKAAAASVSTTLGALLLTTPLTAARFGALSLVSPLANLLILWAVSLVFVGGLLTALTGLVWGGLAGVLGAAVALPARYVLWMVKSLSRFSLAAVPSQGLYLRGWLLLVYGIALLALIPGWRRRARPILPVCGCLCALCAALVCTVLEARLPRLTLSVLDVGQGQSVALASRGRTALVDCGGNSRRNGGDIAADFLQSTGHAKLDLLILTHFHADHANGVPELLARLPVDRLVIPDVQGEDPFRQEIVALAEEAGTEVILLTENSRVTLGEAVLRLYRPLGDGGANEAGLSVLCTMGEFDALITGDMNTAVEKRLVKYGDLPDIELLVAGHHGSKYASSPELLLAVKPEYAAVSAGYNNYGQPAGETLERLAAAGCAIYRTDWMGRLTFTVR